MESLFQAPPDQGSAAAGLAGGDHVFQSQRLRIYAAFPAPVDEIKTVGRGAADARRPQLTYAVDQPYGIAGADRDGRAAQFIETVIGRAADEGAGVDTDDDGLPG